jgi:CRISPR-associated protein (Cas_Cas02710)
VSKRFLAALSFFASVFAGPALLSLVTTESNKRWVLIGALILAFPAAYGFARGWQAFERASEKLGTRRKWRSLTAGQVERRKVVIATIGPNALDPFKGGPSLIETLVGRRQPERLVLLHTKGTGDLDAAYTSIEALGLSTKIHTFPVDVERYDEMSLDESPARAAIEWVRRTGYADRDIVVDITSGSKPMSVAAYTVAVEEGVDVEYVRQDNGNISVLTNRAEGQ